MKVENLSVPCVVDPTRTARIESATAVQLNWEVFFFCDEAARKRFLRDPLRWCGALTDPVTLQRFVPTDLSPRARFEERTYYFLDAGNHDRFVTNPAQYTIVPAYMLGETRRDVEDRAKRRREKEAAAERLEATG